MILTEIRTYLNSLGTLGTIVIGLMPASPDVMGLLQEYGGRAPLKGFGVAGIQYERPAFQLTFRGVAFDYNGPRVKAEIAYKALAALPPGPLSGIQYLQIDPQQAPHPVASIDNNNRHYIGINFYSQKEPS